MADEDNGQSHKFQAGPYSLVISGSLLRLARAESELHDPVEDPAAVVAALRRAGRRADLFTFMQRLPDTEPKFPGLHLEWDNVAAVPVGSFEHWWTEQINDKTRNMVRKLEKKGGEIRLVALDEALAAGITAIYNEMPIRQGKKFWHFGKNADEVLAENATFPERSLFIGAYFKGRLIGFVKLVCEQGFASMMQIISMVKHRDKAPTNALVAKAVEICSERGIPYLVYAKYIYGRKGADSLSDFKRHNGFEKIDLPRYYVPLNLWGRLALRWNWHHGFREKLPRWVVMKLLAARGKWYERRNGRTGKSGARKAGQQAAS
jgi:hypothetical protein